MDARNLVKSDARNRAKPFTFYPPKLNRFVSSFFRATLPGVLRRTNSHR